MADAVERLFGPLWRVTVELTELQVRVLIEFHREKARLGLLLGGTQAHAEEADRLAAILTAAVAANAEGRA